MFILARKNIALPSKDYTSFFRVRTGDLVEVPEQFCSTPYFLALVKDGKIAVPETKREKDVVAADEKAEKTLDKVEKRTRKPKD